MKLKLRGLTLTFLLVASFYFLADRSGLVDNFNKNFTEVPQIQNPTLSSKIQNTTSLCVSFLRDPEVNEFKIYRGAMKKAAVDRMDHLKTMTIVEVNKSAKEIEAKLEALAKSLKANAVIIDSAYTVAKMITK